MVYDITLGGEPIGKAEVRQEGLYYRISGKCSLSGSVIYKLQAAGGENILDLGILVPEGDRYCVNTQVPVKRLETGKLEFRAVPRHGELSGEFVPLSAEEPFAYIRRLETAYLQIRNGKPGLVIK